MCGIHFSITKDGFPIPKPNIELLSKRGPDSLKTLHETITLPPSIKDNEYQKYHVKITSSVLSLRGATLTEQPIRDEARKLYLCWNGEAWKFKDQPIDGNDGLRLFENLVEASATVSALTEKAVINVLANVNGPFAFVFADLQAGKVFFGRDCLGRRSLLSRNSIDQDGSFVISSISDGDISHDWLEVEADGFYILDLSRIGDTLDDNSVSSIRKIPFVARSSSNIPHGLFMVSYLQRLALKTVFFRLL